MHTIGNTVFVGKVLMHFPFLGSTNSYAIELASKSNPSEGTVISTYNQQQGRGQIGSRWHGQPDKNITLSVILHPRFLPIRKQFLLSQAVSLAVYDFISAPLDRTVKIKWPNDVYVEDRKIAGILIQNTLLSNQLHTSVVGLGINVNQLDFPADLPKATSLALESDQRQYVLDDMVVRLCQSLERRYLQLRRGEEKALQQDYLHRLYQFMQEGLYARADGEVFSGRITGVSDSGKLLVDHKQGQEAFDIKELRYL
ncbi:MAG: biotin--[acetyl-CoA-carboxylase] ligase [Bacteroidota bacterium]